MSQNIQKAEKYLFAILTTQFIKTPIQKENILVYYIPRTLLKSYM